MAAEKENIYQALIAAFSLISYADGVAHPAETSRLIKIMNEEHSMRGVAHEQILKDTSVAVKSLDENFDKGKVVALKAIEKIKADSNARDLVLKVAHLTLLSDARLLESEETLLADIQRSLGVPLDV